MEVRPPIMIRLKIIIFNIDVAMNQEDILAEVHKKNFQNMTIDEIKANMKMLFKVGPRNKPTVHWVAEVSPDLRRSLLQRQALYIGWNSSNLTDFVSVTRCIKCYQFGHTKKLCKNPIICRHCAKAGHNIDTCPDKLVPLKCASCKN